MEKWTSQNTDDTKYLGIVEFQDNKAEWHNFEILQNPDVLIFGSSTNAGFLESGYTPISDCFSIDENLQALVEDLETYYNDGQRFCNVIICNERM